MSSAKDTESFTPVANGDAASSGRETPVGMYVVKRNGRKEAVLFDKITARIKNLCYGLDKAVDPSNVTQKVVAGVVNGITTVQLDNLAAETAAYMTTVHPDYGILAGRIAVSNLQKETSQNFSDVVKQLYEYVDQKTGRVAKLISDKVYKIIMDNKEELDSAVVYERDFNFDYFGFKTLERSYLLKIEGRVAERPQHMLMRVAVGIHMEDLEAAIETYNLMSEKWFIHASPTLFNAGTPVPQLSSCFLIAMKDDSIDGIYDTLKRCALISKSAGGIGLHIHNIRATGSYIRGTNGTSNGIVPMLRVFNSTARYVDQGGGKRPGAFAIYLEPWHADVFEYLNLKKNTGMEEVRARDLFYAMWIPDLFMRRVKEGGDWSLFCPTEARGLADTFGEEFDKLFEQYEKEGKARKTVKAQELWFAILDSQMETGTPYMLYKDAANMKSNQKNLGTIKSSNLCTEIMEYTDENEVAVCNLASISLPKFVINESTFDFNKLYTVTKVVARNLNKVIDINHYPIQEARNSNMRHRPIGIGVQGLADAFMKMRLPFESDGARKLNKDIFETIYFAALTASMELAKKHGAYETFKGSPASQGVLQFDMWKSNGLISARDGLKEDIKRHGLRNSLLLAPMPTASTSQILGNNECFEPYTSNIYSRRVLAGNFTIVNPHLLKDLNQRGLWSTEMKDRLIANNGSVQDISEIPADLKQIYKTVWEIKMRSLIDMAAERGAFICQSQSLNLFMKKVNYARLTSMHFYAWEKGLKTGMYYLRTTGAADAIKFTVDKKALDEKKRVDAEKQIGCALGTSDGDACVMCSA